MGLHALGPRLSRAVGAALALLLAGALVPTPAEAAAASVVYHGSRTKPYIALTIDDGYNAPNCRRAADILRAMNVPATYFHHSAAHRCPGHDGSRPGRIRAERTRPMRFLRT